MNMGGASAIDIHSGVIVSEETNDQDDGRQGFVMITRKPWEEIDGLLNDMVILSFYGEAERYKLKWSTSNIEHQCLTNGTRSFVKCPTFGLGYHH